MINVRVRRKGRRDVGVGVGVGELGCTRFNLTSTEVPNRASVRMARGRARAGFRRLHNQLTLA